MNQNQQHIVSSPLILLVASAGVLLTTALARAETAPQGSATDTSRITLSPRKTLGNATDSTPSRAMTQTTVALGLTAIAVLAGLTLSKKLLPGLSRDSATRAVRVLSQTPLGARGAVYLLQCGQRVLVIGASSTQITTLAEIIDPDEIDDLLRPVRNQELTPSAPPVRAAGGRLKPTGDLKGQIDSMLDNLEGWNATT